QINKRDASPIVTGCAAAFEPLEISCARADRFRARASTEAAKRETKPYASKESYEPQIQTGQRPGPIRHAHAAVPGCCRSIPGVNECSGGAFFGAVDPWVSFAPNGATYVVSLALYAGTAIAINKSNDGGLHWSEPIIVDANTDPRFSPDKPSITADATDSHYV